MREMIAACLRPSRALPFRTRERARGIERLSLKKFDLVILDLNMPDIGGIEVVEFIRAQDRLRELPILIVTTRGDDASRTRALEVGASAIHDQAVRADALLLEVRALLHRDARAAS